MKDLHEELMLSISESEISSGDKLEVIVNVLCDLGANTIGTVSTFKYFIPLMVFNLRLVETENDIRKFNTILGHLYTWLNETKTQSKEDWLESSPRSLKYH